MTSLPIRSLLVASITTVLAACGGNAEQQAPIQTAALIQSSAAAAPAASTTAPQPDCAPEGCKGLRIIDANAEAYRLDAQRRDAGNGEPAQL